MSGRLEVDVAIVGGGPAGLAAAIALRAAGIGRVVVLEREAEAGGVPRHCAHPPYGLREFGQLMTGPAYAARLRQRAVEAGVDIRLRHAVVALAASGRLGVATPDGAVDVLARRVVLATGARETPRAARRLAGDRPLGVLNTGALQSYLHLKGLKPFRRPLIVGTELVGLSAVWTCLRHGIRPVAVIEEGARGTARWPLTLFPRLCGIPVRYGWRIADIGGTERIERVDIVDHAGGRETLACDGVLLTGQFVPEASLMRAGAIAVDRHSGGPVVDERGQCSDPAYFAAGNVLRPIENAGWCYREGHRAGEAVAADLAAATAGQAPPETVAIECGEAVKLVVPQRLSRTPHAAACAFLQVRLARPAAGVLSVRADDAVVWSRTVRSRPERRILIPIGPWARTARPRRFVVSVER